MSKVLMITYVFPPAAWVGAHRTLKYCKYLGAHGWTPVVLTAKPIGVTFQDYMIYDLSAAENIGVGDLSRLDDRTAISTAAQLIDAFVDGAHEGAHGYAALEQHCRDVPAGLALPAAGGGSDENGFCHERLPVFCG